MTITNYNNFVEFFFDIIIFWLDIAPISKNTFSAIAVALNFFDKISKEVPWRTVKEKLDHLESYHNDYSKEAAGIIAEIKKHMTAGIAAYKKSLEQINQWCDDTKKSLESYIKLFHNVNKANTNEQKIF